LFADQTFREVNTPESCGVPFQRPNSTLADPEVRGFKSACGWRIVTGGPILPVIALRASELALAFGTDPVAVKRSDPQDAL